MRIKVASEVLPSLEANVYLAQRHAGSLSGLELRRAATIASNLSTANDWHLLAADRSGERIIGAALIVGECLIADSSRRYDGTSILLVAGMIAGPLGLMQASSIARSAGAQMVHAMHLGGWGRNIDECDSVWCPDAESSWDKYEQSSLAAGSSPTLPDPTLNTLHPKSNAGNRRHSSLVRL